jgi:hypothetical protein
MPLRGCRKTGPLHSLYQTHWSRRCHPALCNVPLTPAPSPSPTFCQDLFICICHLKKDHLIKFSPAGMGIVQIRWKSCWSCCRKSVSLPQLCSIECSSIIATCSSTLVLPPPPLTCQIYPLWDRTKVARENVTFGYSFITPNASMLGLPDFSLCVSP